MTLNLISNFVANVAQRNLSAADNNVSASLTKLSSGRRVTAAKDDSAALAVGSRLDAEVAGLKQAALNAGQAISMMQIADGAMARVNDILVRMKSLTVQATSEHVSTAERSMLNTEYVALRSEIDRIAADASFAGSQLVNGSIEVDMSAASAYAKQEGVENMVFRGDFTSSSDDWTVSYFNSGLFRVEDGTTRYEGTVPSDANNGTQMVKSTVFTLTHSSTTNKIDIVLNLSFEYWVNHSSQVVTLSGGTSNDFLFKLGTGVSSSADEIATSLNSISAAAFSFATTNISSTDAAEVSATAVDSAIDDLQTYRAELGANMNRMELAAANAATILENTEAARSQLLDLDVASEMSNFVAKQILVQSGASMLAQANLLPSNLLRLFQ